jgi:hypothetical protein
LEHHTFELLALLLLNVEVLLHKLVEIAPLAIFKVHKVTLLGNSVDDHRLIPLKRVDLHYIWVTFQNLSNFELCFGVRKLIFILERFKYFEALNFLTMAIRRIKFCLEPLSEHFKCFKFPIIANLFKLLNNIPPDE